MSHHKEKIVTAHPGAFCSPAGATDATIAGTSMVCSVGPTGGTARWRRNGPTPARKPRRAGRKTATGATLPQVNTGIDPTKPAAPVPAPAVETATTPKTETTPTGKPAPIDGHSSNRDPIPNNWGRFGNSSDPVNFHNDGPLGYALKDMGPDARMDIDGQPLADVIGKAATDVVMGRDTAQGCLDRMRTLHDRLPAGSRAKRELADAISQMDAPMTPAPQLPDDAPQPLHQLAKVLHTVPMCRRDQDREIGPLLDIARRAATGETRGSRLTYEVMRLHNCRHESKGELGKFQIDRAVRATHDALDLDRRIAAAALRLPAATGAERRNLEEKLYGLRQQRGQIHIG